MTDDIVQRLRGKCLPTSEEAVDKDPTLRLVRGWYFCPIANREEEHWWTERFDGTVFDPTAVQFPSNGSGVYTEFTGSFACDECGKYFVEADGYDTGNGLHCCSSECFGRMVGLL